MMNCGRSIALRQYGVIVKQADEVDWGIGVGFHYLLR